MQCFYIRLNKINLFQFDSVVLFCPPFKIWVLLVLRLISIIAAKKYGALNIQLYLKIWLTTMVSFDTNTTTQCSRQNWYSMCILVRGKLKHLLHSQLERRSLAQLLWQVTINLKFMQVLGQNIHYKWVLVSWDNI